MYRYRNGDASECIILRNRPPRWNAALGAYCLHFGGRVTHASVKNIQLVSDDDTVSEQVFLHEPSNRIGHHLGRQGPLC